MSEARGAALARRAFPAAPAEAHKLAVIRRDAAGGILLNALRIKKFCSPLLYGSFEPSRYLLSTPL